MYCASTWAGLFFERDYHPYRRAQLKRLDAIYPISNAGKCDILNHYGQFVEDLTSKVITLYLGIHFPYNKVNPWQKSQKVTIVSCAEVKQLKRIDLLIDALATLDIPIHWIHFGEGELTDYIMQYASQQLADKGNISYEFTGRVLKSKILEFYETHSVDMLVNTSDQEGIPVSIMEAMAYGIPVIARNIGGNSELVNDTCGILLAPEVTPSEIAKAIMKLVTLDYEYCLEMRKKAKDIICDQYNDDKNYASLYLRYIDNGDEK